MRQPSAQVMTMIPGSARMKQALDKKASSKRVAPEAITSHTGDDTTDVEVRNMVRKANEPA